MCANPSPGLHSRAEHSPPPREKRDHSPCTSVSPTPQTEEFYLGTAGPPPLLPLAPNPPTIPEEALLTTLQPKSRPAWGPVPGDSPHTLVTLRPSGGCGSTQGEARPEGHLWAAGILSTSPCAVAQAPGTPDRWWLPWEGLWALPGAERRRPCSIPTPLAARWRSSQASPNLQEGEFLGQRFRFYT